MLLKIFHSDLIILLTSVGGILLLARIFAELAKKIKTPGIMGELVLGILLGPTFLGVINPEIFETFFPSEGSVKIAMDGLFNLSVTMLLFVVGMETQLHLMLKHGKAAVYTSFVSMVIPFVLGFLVVWYFPEFFDFWVEEKLPYALFFGTAMAISALPVITRILMDLNLLHTKVGAIITASAIFVDLAGWLIFSFVLTLIGQHTEHSSIGFSIIMILSFGIFMLTIGRAAISKTLLWIQKKPAWVGGVQSVALGFCFLSAAFTEYLGMHAILGAFIMGIAFGESVHMPEREKEVINQFVTNVFAPLFFVSIGLKVNFITKFDFSLVALVFILAVGCKVLGGALGAYLGGLTKRESWAVGFGLNARGAMEIIMGTLALNAHLIDQSMFIALVIMALLTSIISGPLMKRFID